MTEDALKESWAKRGFSFGTGTVKIGDGIAKAVHEEQEEIIVMAAGKGKLKFTIDDKSFVIENDNSEVIIPAKATHSIDNLGSVDTKIHFGYRSVK